MNKTPFHDRHLALNAKMVEFAGYEMPISYAGIKDEHQAVRNSVGVFDVSHMGEFILKGDGALDLIQRVTSNDAASLQPGEAQYSCMPTDEGGIVDDLLVYHLEDGNWMLVVNASNIQKDWDHIMKHNTGNVEMHDISAKTGLLAVQGPKAVEALQSLTDIDLSAIKFYTFTKGVFAGIDKVLISATGYTGSGGFEIYVEDNADDCLKIWDAIFEAGKEFNIQPVGLGARDTLRLEMGYCLYGNDIDDSTSALEAGLGWITKLDAKDFTGKQHLLNQKENGFDSRLAAFEMKERGIPRQGYDIFSNEGEKIGRVTSGTMAPSLEKGIGMGYIQKPFNKSGTEIQIGIRDKLIKAETVRLPFYKG